ncbi:hypothetical protein C8R48DRAFT_675920 [Suillus tomentosus]|nr:hypothetical protein C8R48DRAFT_675920 [Suillus tomentosus]
MVFLYDADNSAPFFDSILFREDAFFTFSFVLRNCPEATAVLPFVGYVPVGSLMTLYPLYSTQAGVAILGSLAILSAYLRTPLVHCAVYEQRSDMEVPIYALEPQSRTFNLPYVGQKIGHDGNHYNLFTCDSDGTAVHLALHPAGYEPIPHAVGFPALNFTSFPPALDLTFGLTQPFIPLNTAMVDPRSILESSTADSSESGLVGPSSIFGSSILETSYIGSSAYPARGGDTDANISKNLTGSTGTKRRTTQKTDKPTLSYIMTRYPNWRKALAYLRCMLRVAVCRGGHPSLFLLVTADYATERKALIISLWPETLVRFTMADDNVMSDMDILALGDAWFSLWMYDNKRHASTSVMTNRAGFDLKHLFGITLHDKILSIVSKLMPPQSNCLPFTVNGLVKFLRHQVSKESVYHVVFRQNATPGYRICLADLDPTAFREAAHPPVATLALVVTTCYDVFLDTFDEEFKDTHVFMSPSEMHKHVCETLPMLFEQSDDPDYTSFMAAMSALCTINEKLDFKTLMAIMRHNWAITPNSNLLGHNENDLVYWLQTKGHETLPESLFTAASVLFGLVDPLDIKTLIEVSLKEDATQTGLHHEEESCLEYLKEEGVSPCRTDPKKVATPKAVGSVGARQSSISVSCFQPTKAVQDKCHAWLRTSSQSQDITRDSNAGRILRDFPSTLQCPCLHDHVLRPDDQFIPLPHVMKTWVDNFTYGAYMSASLAESNEPLRLDHSNSFTTKEFKSVGMLKSDFHILDLKKQRAQSEVDMLSEAIARIAEFHHNDDGTTETDESDSSDDWSDDWMSTSYTSSPSLSLS